MKKDYQKTLPPASRKIRAHYAIRQALEEGKKTFSGLLEETGLGRSTLAIHLKEMFAKGEVDRETYPKDYRITVYRLKRATWTPELQKEEDIETLTTMDVDSNITPDFLTNLAKDLPKLLWSSLVEPALLTKQDSEFLKEYVSYSMYGVKPEKNEGKKTDMKQLAEKTALSVMKGLFLEPRYLENLSDFSIVMRFKKVSELAKKLEEQRLQQEEGLNLPRKPGEDHTS